MKRVRWLVVIVALWLALPAGAALAQGAPPPVDPGFVPPTAAPMPTVDPNAPMPPMPMPTHLPDPGMPTTVPGAPPPTGPIVPPPTGPVGPGAPLPTTGPANPPTFVPGAPAPTAGPGAPGGPPPATFVPGVPAPTFGPGDPGGVPPATLVPGQPTPTFAPGDPGVPPTFVPGVPEVPGAPLPGDPAGPIPPPRLTETPRTPVPVVTFAATPPPIAPPTFTFDPTLFGPPPIPPGAPPPVPSVAPPPFIPGDPGGLPPATFVPGMPVPTFVPGAPIPTFVPVATFAPPPTPVATITLGDFEAGAGVRLALPPAMFGTDQGTIGIVPAPLPTFTFDPAPPVAPAPGGPPAAPTTTARPPVVVGAFTLTLNRQRSATPTPAAEPPAVPGDPGAPASPTVEPTASAVVERPIQIVQKFTPPQGFTAHRSLSFFRKVTSTARTAQQTTQWEKVPTIVDSATNTAIANTNVPGDYVLMDQALVPQATHAVYVPSVKPGTLLSSITLRNAGSSAATARLRFTKPDGTSALASDPSYTVPANGTALVYLPSIAELPGGDFALKIESTAPISAVANHSQASNNASTGYAAIAESGVDLQLYFPQVYKAYFGFDSNVVLQNTGAGTATVSVAYLGANGYQLATETRFVPAGASTTFDQSANAALNDGFAGSAIVTSTQRLAGVANVSGANGTLLASAVGVGAGAQQGYVPSLYKGYYGFDSSLLIQNADAVPASVEMTYSTGLKKTLTVPVGSSALVFQPNEPDLPASWQGSAVVRSTNGARILAVGNVQNAASGRLSAYNAPIDGSTDVVLPALYNGYSAAGWASSLTVQNVDTSATSVEIVYGDGWVQRVANLAAGASQLVFQPSVAGLSAGWQGSATVRSIEGRRIIVVVNEEAQAQSLGQADWLISYVGFAQ